MKATKLPSGKWRARAYNKYTKRTKSFTANTQREAERKATAYEAILKEEDTSDMTFAEAMEIYISGRKRTISATTYRTYLSYQDQYYDSINNIPIDRINNDMMQDLVDYLLETRARKTVKNIVALASSVIHSQMPSKSVKYTIGKIGKPKLELPSQEQIEALLACCEDDFLVVAVYLGVFCGMRREEVCGLTMDKVDFRRKKITVDKAKVKNYQNKWVIKNTKTEEPRIITPPDVVFEKIKKYGLPKYNPDRISDHFPILLKKNNIEHFTFHGLRHYCCAMMLSKGLPISYTREYLGWTDEKTLMRIYDYVISEVRDKSADIWNDVSKELAKNLPQTPKEHENP